MRLLSVRPVATVLLLVVTLLIARASFSNLHTPAAAQGTVPTATATPDPTVVPTAPSDVHDAQDQLGGLFSQIEGDPPPSSDVETLASRLVGIDFGQLANAIESPVGPKDPVTGIPQTPHKLVLNLFADVEHPCVSGGAVVDATNEGLVSDCGMLLAARDTLAGTASLNWSADTPITEWNGVALGEASGRVTEILLVGMGLNGRIPPELGGLSNLTGLFLSGNQLTGEIPPELGGLSNLTELGSRRQPVDGRDSA